MDTIEDFSSAVSEFLSADNERAALIFAFSLLEQFVGDLIKVKCKHPSSYSHVSASLKINILHEIDAINKDEYQAICWLKKQRNEAAHKPGYKVNESEINQSWIMNNIQAKSLLHKFLATTVLGFWNEHLEILELYEFEKNA